LTDQTKGVVDARRLGLMKPTAFVINTARGPIVDEQALINALQSGRIAGAGLDVFEQEPSLANNPLNEMKNVILTPHALCWTDQCFANIGAADIKAVENVLSGEVPEGIVNRAILDNQNWRKKLTG
jgi:phosphoglycerate dehydrogenase-like enzyme